MRRAASSTASPSRSTATPICARSSIIVRTSRSRGTLVSRNGVDESSAAHISGSAAFLAPETRVSPRSGTPPWIASLSMRSSVGGTRRSIRRESGEKEASVATYARVAQSSGV